MIFCLYQTRGLWIFKYLRRFHQVFPEVLKRSDRIIAVSRFLKDQIINYYQVPDGKIDVIYPGCAPQSAPIKDDDCRAIIKDKFGMEGDFILYSCSMHARKNLHVLISLFSKIHKHLDNIKLVISGCTGGKRHEYFLKIRSLVEQLNLEGSVIFMGTVNYEDMPYLYSSAKCALNLSLYEGFPMSTIEAMACGTPTLCLNTAYSKETAGDGAA